MPRVLTLFPCHQIPEISRRIYKLERPPVRQAGCSVIRGQWRTSIIGYINIILPRVELVDLADKVAVPEYVVTWSDRRDADERFPHRAGADRRQKSKK